MVSNSDLEFKVISPGWPQGLVWPHYLTCQPPTKNARILELVPGSTILNFSSIPGPNRASWGGGDMVLPCYKSPFSPRFIVPLLKLAISLSNAPECSETGHTYLQVLFIFKNFPHKKCSNRPGVFTICSLPLFAWQFHFILVFLSCC